MNLIIGIPLYVSFQNSVEKFLKREAQNTSTVIAELRALYTTEVVNKANKSCVPVMGAYDEVEGAIPLPATLSIMLGERLSKGNFEGQVKLYSKFPFPWREKTGGLKDQFSQNAWAFLIDYPDSSYSEIQTINNEEIIRYATGDVLKRGCVNCHNTYKGTPKNDWVENDLRGVLEIQKPTKNIKEELKSNFLLTGFIILFCALLLILFIHKILTFLKGEISDKVNANTELSALKVAFDKTAIVATANKKGEILDVNEKFCAISKYSKEELIGQNHRILSSGHHSKEFFIQMWKVISSGNVWRDTIKNSAKDGSHYWVDSTIIPLKDSNNKVYQYISIRFDVTKSKLDEQKILDHNSDLTNFAHIISHDLKAPLRGIQTLSDFIIDDLGDDLPEGVKSNFSLMKGRISRMNNLITGVLNFSKHSISKEGKLDVIDLNELINQIFADIDLPVNYEVNIYKDFPKITGNRVKMHQIFGNLIWNAIKYNSNDNPTLEIGFQEDESKGCTYFVKDNGPGIAPEYQEKVFVIFQTLNSRDTVESTGVGLSIVKKMINQQGGEIWIDSDGKSGSTFLFTLS